MTNEQTEKLATECTKFATRMRKIPRRALRCEIYGTVTVVVDRAHTLNILRKVISPLVNTSIAYEAINVLQDRLDAA